MITHLILDNFLAHEHTEIEFSHGVTVLSGMNNTGKSSVVEAIRCLATNPVPKFFIRHGAKEARVEARFSGGESVAWIRRSTWAKYEVRVPGEEEPRTYAKFGRRPPEDVLDILRLNLVELDGGDNTVDVHIGDQRKPVFLLDQSGFNTASFFASSSESAYLLDMQRLLKSRVQDTKREKKRVELRKAELGRELDSLVGLPELTLECEALREEERVLRASDAQLPALEAVLTHSAALKRSAELADHKLGVLSETRRPPDLYPAAELAGRVRDLHRLHKAEQTAKSRSNTLEKLLNPPDLFPAEPLDRAVRFMDVSRRTVVKEDRRISVLKDLAPPPELFAVRPLETAVRESRRAIRTLKREEQRAEKLASLTPPPEPEDLSRPSQTVAELNRMRRAVHKAEAEFKAAGERVEAFKITMDARLAEIGRCPLCGNELSAECFAEEGGCHE